MKLSVHDGNSLYDGTLNFPLEKKHSYEFPSGPGMLSISTICDSIIIASRGGYLVCINSQNQETVWEYNQSGRSGIGGCCDSSGLFLTLKDEELASVDINTGNIIWKKSPFSAWSLSDECVFGYHLDLEPPPFYCFNRSDGTERWQYNETFGFEGNVLIHSNIVIKRDSEGMHGIDETNGACIWKFEDIEIMKQRFPERLSKWERDYRRDSTSVTYPSGILHCVVEGIAVVSWGIGVVCALDIQTGEIKWSWFFPQEREFHQPKTVIYRDGRLYLHDNQSFGIESYLTCIDAATGEEQWSTDERVTPQGCSNAAMVGKYFVGGSKEYLAVWDVEVRERVWLFQSKKGDIFSGPVGVVPNGLVFSDPDTNCLHWFESS